MTLLAAGLFLLLGTLAVPRLAFDDDEFQHAHVAWLIARGEVPHRDFFEHHLPLYHIALAPFTLGDIHPDRILLFRFFSVVIATGTLLSLARAARLWTGSESAAVLAWLAFSPIFFVKSVEVRPEGLCMLFAAIALVLLGRKTPRVFIAGLLAGAMVSGSQKFVFLSGGLFFLTLFSAGPRATFRFALGGAVVPLLNALVYVITGAGPAAWQQLVVMNATWKESFSPAMYGGMLWTTSGALLALAAAGFLVPASTRARLAGGVMLAFGIAAVLLVPIPFRQTWMMVYPGLFLAATPAWKALEELIPEKRPRRFGLTLLTLIGLLPAASEFKREFADSPAEDLALMRLLHENTKGPYFDGRGLMFHRPHIGYHAWVHEGLMMMLDPEEHAESTIAAIREAGFPNILLDYRFDYMSETLRTFVDAHYVAVEPAPLMVPGVRVDRARLAAGTLIDLPVPGKWKTLWNGGQVTVNDAPVESGDIIDLPDPAVRVRGRGFIRDFRFERAEDRP